MRRRSGGWVQGKKRGSMGKKWGVRREEGQAAGEGKGGKKPQVAGT